MVNKKKLQRNAANKTSNKQTPQQIKTSQQQNHNKQYNNHGIFDSHPTTNVLTRETKRQKHKKTQQQPQAEVFESGRA